MKMLAGTSGFSYPEWRGSFYPEKLKPSQMLSYYAEKLPAVELNNTFYRMPRATTVAEWANATPVEFRFVLKASRRITHFSRLKDAAEPLAYLLRSAEQLGPKLGPVLFQLPPQLARDLPLLEDFLSLLPPSLMAAFEFRHASWFADETYEALAASGVALCGGDLDDARKAPPLVKTADYGYLRLRRTEYSESDIHSWAESVDSVGWRECFAFFKHEQLGPALAQCLNSLFTGDAGRGT